MNHALRTTSALLFALATLAFAAPDTPLPNATTIPTTDSAPVATPVEPTLPPLPAVPPPAPAVSASEIPAAAAAAPAAKTADHSTAQLTVKNIITRGGGIMYALVALSVLTVMLVLFCLLTLRTGIICPITFLRQAQDAAESGDFDTLSELSHANASPFAKVLSAACEQHIPGRPLDLTALRQIMEEEGARQVSRLWGRAQYLMDVGTIAPMVGLLGTVWGMMVSFTGLESGVAIVNKADRLASGVSQAMFTTFGGLVIAIVAFTAYALFRSRINRLTAELETACAAILRRLAVSPHAAADNSAQDAATAAKNRETQPAKDAKTPKH